MGPDEFARPLSRDRQENGTRPYKRPTDNLPQTRWRRVNGGRQPPAHVVGRSCFLLDDHFDAALATDDVDPDVGFMAVRARTDPVGADSETVDGDVVKGFG